MTFLKRISMVSLTLFVVGCAEKAAYRERSENPTPPEVAEEKNLVLKSEEIVIRTKKGSKSSPLKANILEVGRRTPPESLSKDFTFPSNFHGFLKFAWAGYSATKPGPSPDRRLGCNDSQLMNLRYTVIDQEGNEREYYEDDIVEIRSGDVLRVSVKLTEFDCTSFTTQFTATLVDKR